MKYIGFICLFLAAVCVGHWAVSPWNPEEAQLSSLSYEEPSIQEAGQFYETLKFWAENSEEAKDFELSCVKDFFPNVELDEAKKSVQLTGLNNLKKLWIEEKSFDVALRDFENCETSCSCAFINDYMKDVGGSNRIEVPQVQPASKENLLECARKYQSKFCDQGYLMEDLKGTISLENDLEPFSAQ